MKKNVKSIRKLPKYYNGELRVTPEQALGPNPQLKAPGHNFNMSGGNTGMTGGQIAGAVGQGLQMVSSFANNVARSREEGVSFGSVLGGVGSGAAMGASLGSVIPGIGTAIGAVAGGVIGGITSSIGRSGSVDMNTGEVQKSDGLTRLFGWGRSDRSLLAKSDRIKTSINDKEIKSDLETRYANDYANSLNHNVFTTAAEGGIMRRPVDALVSKGELIYNPVTKKLSKIPGDKGKPNKADDVYTRLYEGDVVVSNSPTMIMPNGKTPALNLEGLVDKYATGGTVKAREAIIKKVVNWLEANKTKPQEYTMFNGGGIAQNKNYNKNIEHSSDYAKMSWYDAGNAANYAATSKDIIDWLNANPEELEKAKVALSNLPQMKKHLTSGKTFMEALKLNISDGIYGQVHDYFVPNLNTVNKKSRSINDFTSEVASKLNVQIPKPSTNQPQTDVNASTLGSLYGSDGNVAVKPKEKNTENNNKFDWTQLGDIAYGLSSVLTPLFDREKPDPVHYRVPTLKQRPVGIDTSVYMKDIDDTFGIARYNQANINPSTGAGMAYGLQAASNRANQRANIRQWQANTQNELIGKNIDAYNRWSENYANIMNNVYDKVDANRAAARNINRQNRAQAFKNMGQILRDYKQEKWNDKIFDLYNKTFNS